MASSDTFREQLKAGNIPEALALALTQATQLKITTWVASGSATLAGEEPKPGHRLQTEINSLEGAIKNEIGDQFLGNGPYRELLPFHLDQVSQGNLMIKNNLQSLQKLFEVLVALHQQAGIQPTIDLKRQLATIETQQFLPQELAPEVLPVTRQELITPEVAVETPNLIAEVELPVAVPELIPEEEVAVETSEAIAELELSTETSEAIAELELPTETSEAIAELELPTETSEAIPQEIVDEISEFAIAPDIAPDLKPPDHQEISVTPTDEDDDVLDFLASLPVPPVPPPGTLDFDSDDDWQDLNDEEPALELTSSESDSDQDWGILELADFEPSEPESEPEITQSISPIAQDETKTINLKAEPNQPIPSLESLDLEAEQDWDEWVVDEPEIIHKSLLNQQDDDDWGDLVEDFDPFATTPPLNGLTADSDLDEDWDNFAVDELEPYSDIKEVDISFDAANTRENVTTESDIFPEKNRDRTHSHETDSLTEENAFPENLEPSSPKPKSRDWSKEDPFDPMEDLFDQTDLSADQDDNDMQTMEEVLFNEMSFEEFLVEDFDPLGDSDDDWDDQPKSVESGEPPLPPPPPRFPKSK